MAPMSECTSTSAARLKRWADRIKQRWICGDTALTTSVHMMRSRLLTPAELYRGSPRKYKRDTGRSGISQHVHAQGKPAWNDQNGCSAAFPHYGASRMECRAQASRSRSAGSVVRPAPAWPGRLDHKQFYSSGSPLEQRCKKWRLSTRIKLQIETYSVKIYQQSVTDVLS